MERWSVSTAYKRELCKQVFHRKTDAVERAIPWYQESFDMYSLYQIYLSVYLRYYIRAVLVANKRDAQTEERLGVFLFLAVNMFTNKCPSEQKEEQLTVKVSLTIQASEGNET